MGNKAKSLTEFSKNANKSLARDRNVLKGGTEVIRDIQKNSLMENINWTAAKLGKANPQEGQ